MTENYNDSPLNTSSGWEDAYAQHSDENLWREEPIWIMSDAIASIRARGLRTVVDIGCGDGRNLEALAGAGLTCVGIDLSSTALMRAQTRLSAAGVPAFLVQGDATDLGFVDKSVDTVTCFDLFGQLADPASFIAQVHRILAPNGLFILNAYTTNDDAFGMGDPVSEKSFIYKNTLFRFFEEDELRALFSGWQLARLTRESWVDPPHGDFRPVEHSHESFIIFAVPKS